MCETVQGKIQVEIAQVTDCRRLYLHASRKHVTCVCPFRVRADAASKNSNDTGAKAAAASACPAGCRRRVR